MIQLDQGKLRIRIVVEGTSFRVMKRLMRFRWMMNLPWCWSDGLQIVGRLLRRKVRLVRARGGRRARGRALEVELLHAEPIVREVCGVDERAGEGARPLPRRRRASWPSRLCVNCQSTTQRPFRWKIYDDKKSVSRRKKRRR